MKLVTVVFDHINIIRPAGRPLLLRSVAATPKLSESVRVTAGRGRLH